MSGYKVNFSATDAGFSGTVSKIKSSMDSMDDNVKKVEKGMSMSFGAMAKAGAAFAVGIGAIKAVSAGITGTLGTFKDALDMGGELNDMSQRTGIAIDQLTILRRAFENSGMSADQVGPSVNKLQKSISELGEGAKGPSEAFGKLGISFEDLKDKTPAEQLSMIGEKIAEIESPAQKSAIAMSIFGKSGGQMLALFAGGKDSIAEAAGQLGSLPSIMEKVAATFDTTGDNLAAIQSKLKEFAAGVLSEMTPALELITTMISRIDAAKLGQDFAQMLIGGTTAMNGFADALSAIKLGEFGLAFSIAFESIKLQAAQSANSIYANLKAGISAAVEFMSLAMGPGSGLFTMLKESFSILASEVTLVFARSVSKMVETMSFVSEETKDAIIGNIKDLEVGVEYSKNKISNSMEQIGGDLILASTEAKKAFDESLSSSEKLIDTTQLELGLQQSKVGLLRIQSEEALKGVKTQEAMASLQLSIGGARATNAEKIKELESDIAAAKAQGNKELEGQLKAQKSYLEQLERSLKNGKSLQDAMAEAGKAYSHSLESSANSLEKSTAEMKEQLSLSDRLLANVKESEMRQRIDPNGKIEGRVNEAIDRGNFRRAKREIDKLREAEDEQKIRDFFKKDPNSDFNSKIKMSLKDLARKEGVETFGKTTDEIRDALLQKMKEREKGMDAKQRGKTKEEAAKDGGKGQPAADPMKVIVSTVEQIKQLLAKIEPKLPTPALGA